jgi:hypothetical protein
MRQIFGAKRASERLWIRSQVGAEENGANLGHKLSDYFGGLFRIAPFGAVVFGVGAGCHCC